MRYTAEHEAFQRLPCEARLQASASQQELASRLGDVLPQGQLLVSRSELGQRKVSVVELWFYCQALRISFSEFAQQLDDQLRQLQPAPMDVVAVAPERRSTSKPPATRIDSGEVTGGSE